MYFSLLLILFAIATASHASFLMRARQHLHMSERVRQVLWAMHLWFNSALWSVLIIWIIVIQFSSLHPMHVSLYLKLIGAGIFIVGVVMVITISRVLNFENLMGLRFFYPDKARRVYSSLYRVLNNPMYDGFILILIGLGLGLGVVEDFYLAFTSVVLINFVLASVENYEFRWNPF